MAGEPAPISLPLVREVWRGARRVSQIIWTEKRGLALMLLGVLVVLSAAPFLVSGARAVLLNELVRTAAGGAMTGVLLSSLLFLILAGALSPIVGTVQFYLHKLFWFFLEEKFEFLMIKRKGEMDVAVHEDPKYNDLFNRVRENGIWRVQNFSDRQFFIFQNLLEAVISAVILFVANPWVLFLLAAGTVPELVTEARYGREVWNIYGAKAEVRRRFIDLRRYFDWLPSLVELKIFQNIPYFLSTIKELFGAFQSEQKEAEKKKLIRQFFTVFASQAAIAAAVVWFVSDVVRGLTQVGTLTFFLASVGDFRQALSGLFSNLGRQYQDGLFVRDVFALVDIPHAVPAPKRRVALDPQKTPEIVFEKVTFRYPGTKKDVLKNFSLKIPAGEKIALVGANGAGKTTLVKLLCRFYDPGKGRIFVGGKNLKDVDLETWYHQIGAIFQDYSNYHFAVKEAIAIGRSGAASSLGKVKEAARASEADVFIEEWEKAYDQMLGKQWSEGVEPSIGQWQKLALARTFYRDPRILILDEPTSSVDAEAEAKIFEKLEALPKDRTVILISHRFSTVRQATRICVLKEGRVEELGTHRELLKRNGLYARLFKLQAKGYR